MNIWSGWPGAAEPRSTGILPVGPPGVSPGVFPPEPAGKMPATPTGKMPVLRRDFAIAGRGGEQRWLVCQQPNTR